MLDDVYLLRRVLGEIDRGAPRLERRGKDGGACTVAQVFCVGSSVRSARVLCDLSGMKMASAIFFAFPDLSGVEQDISQAGR